MCPIGAAGAAKYLKPTLTQVLGAAGAAKYLKPTLTQLVGAAGAAKYLKPTLTQLVGAAGEAKYLKPTQTQLVGAAGDAKYLKPTQTQLIKIHSHVFWNWFLMSRRNFTRLGRQFICVAYINKNWGRPVINKNWGRAGMGTEAGLLLTRTGAGPGREQRQACIFSFNVVVSVSPRFTSVNPHQFTLPSFPTSLHCCQSTPLCTAAIPTSLHCRQFPPLYWRVFPLCTPVSDPLLSCQFSSIYTRLFSLYTSANASSTLPPLPPLHSGRCLPLLYRTSLMQI